MEGEQEAKVFGASDRHHKQDSKLLESILIMNGVLAVPIHQDALILQNHNIFKFNIFCTRASANFASPARQHSNPRYNFGWILSCFIFVMSLNLYLSLWRSIFTISKNNHSIVSQF